METLEKIEHVLRHIENVQRNCYKLGFKLIKMGDVELGRKLIKNGQIHDNSKFGGIEFEHLFHDDPILPDVIKHHQSINPHHPEYFSDIKNMPLEYLLEMICDCASRSSEFGTDIRKWFAESATKKYNFSMDDEVGQKITKYLNLLYENPF